VDLLDVLVHARLIGRALDEGRLDLGPLDPLLDVVHEEVCDLVRVAVEEELGQVVVRVDPGARDHLEAGLLGDPAHELDVAAQEHRRGLADRLDPELDRRLRLAHGDLVVLAWRHLVRRVLLRRAGTRPLVVDGLVGVAQVLVDQGRPELIDIHRPGHGLDLRHRREAYSVRLATGLAGILPRRGIGRRENWRESK
jgi:hypothetical protein